MESVTYQIGGNVYSHFHSVKETREAWDQKDGQGNQEARERGKYCVVVGGVPLPDAILLSMIFHRHFAIETCCHYDRDEQVLSMYCGDAGSGCGELAARMRRIATAMGFFSKLRGSEMVDHVLMLEEIDEEGHGLTAWEIDFVDDLLKQVATWGDLGSFTNDQKTKIEQIHEDRCR